MAARRGSGDQGVAVLVLTALLLLPLLTFAAFGVDLPSWYSRISQLQKAADAASLAGTVWMPNLPKATAVATDSLEHNDIVHGVDDVTVVIREGATPTSLRVEITDHSATRFLSGSIVSGGEVLTRTAEAEYFLPLPLGSPLNYFGGDHEKALVADVTTYSTSWPVPHNSTARPPVGPFSCNVGTAAIQGLGQWTSVSNYVAAGFSGSTQCRWTAQTAGTSPAPNLQVPSNVPCNRLQAPTSQMGRWNTGLLGLTLHTYSASNRHTGTVANGNRQCLWAVAGTQPADYASRVPAGGACNITGDILHGSWSFVLGIPLFLPVALLAAPLCQWLPTITSTLTPGTDPIPVSQDAGFWAQVEGPGTVAAYGDAFSTRCTTSLYCSALQSNQWRDSGYWYVIKVPELGAATFTLSVFDALFRRTGDILTKTGDINLGSADTTTNPDFSTEYRVYRQTNPLDISARVPVGNAPSANQDDNSCWWAVTAQARFDMQWQPLCTIAPIPGDTYLLNVRSFSPGAVRGAGLNGYALKAVAPGVTQPALYAYSDMGMFNNGSGTFYLAEVSDSFAGKVLAIDLWDPGDVASGTATIYPMMPSPTLPKPVVNAPATCTYTASPDPNVVNTTAGGWFSTGTRYSTPQASDSAQRCAINTAPTGSAHRFNDEWLRIRIQIPSTYECELGVNPELAGNSCWWGIEYAFTSQPYDVTTWKARIEGNPVHLTS